MNRKNNLIKDLTVNFKLRIFIIVKKKNNTILGIVKKKIKIN